MQVEQNNAECCKKDTHVSQTWKDLCPDTLKRWMENFCATDGIQTPGLPGALRSRALKPASTHTALHTSQSQYGDIITKEGNLDW